MNMRLLEEMSSKIISYHTVEALNLNKTIHLFSLNFKIIFKETEILFYPNLWVEDLSGEMNIMHLLLGCGERKWRHILSQLETPPQLQL
jgi:hypothetical protein